MLPKPVENSWVIDEPIETLWKSSIEALVDKGVHIDILDKESRLIVVVEIFGGSSFREVIAEPSSFYGGQARVNILYTAISETQTRLTVKPVLLAQGRSYVPSKVASNGKLERDYYLLIAGSLPKGKTYEWLEDVESVKEEK